MTLVTATSRHLDIGAPAQRHGTLSKPLLTPAIDVVMHTLAEKLTDYFRNIERPATGTLILNEYTRLHPRIPALLNSPYEQGVTAQGLFNLCGMLPCGRIIAPAEVGLADNTHLPVRPVLTDHTVGWIASLGESTTRLVVALMARVIMADVLGPGTSEVQQRLVARLEHHPWSFDYAGITRVAVLLAAREKQHIVTAFTLADAALLLTDVHAWTSIRQVLGERSAAWEQCTSAFTLVRDSVMEAAPFAHDKLLSAAVFPRDDLVPIPPSLQIADVQLAAAALGFAWPGRRAPAGSGPIDAAPEPLSSASIMTHVVIPGLLKNGLGFPWPEPQGVAVPLSRFVNRKNDDGGWRRLIRRTLEHSGMLHVVEAYGWSFERLMTAIEQGPADYLQPTKPTTAGLGAPPTAMSQLVGTGSSASNQETTPPDIVSTQERITYVELVERLRRVTTPSNHSVVRELALLADHRLEPFGGARVLVLGPPGSGKTTLLAALASASGRPFVRVDAGTIVEHGWQGTTPADLASMIYRAAKHDLAQAERAVVVLDEFCKLAVRTRLGSDHGSAGGSHWGMVKAARQTSLLALLDNGPNLITFTPEAGGLPLQLKTNGLLIVAAGAFQGLEFTGRGLCDHALEAYGLLPELVARLTTRLVLAPPNVSELRDRLCGERGAIAPVRQLAAAFGVELEVTPEAIDMIARATASGDGGLTARTGAGLLQTAARRALLNALDEPSRGIARCVVGPDEVIGLLAPFRSTIS